MKPRTKPKPKPECTQLLITGGRVIDPSSGIDRDMDVLLRDGRVAELAAPGLLTASANETLNAKGCIVAPGFIDLHVHLREPGQSHKETIATGTACRCRRRIYLRLRHAQHQSGERLRRNHPLDAGARTRRRRAAVSHRGGDDRQPGREAHQLRCAPEGRSGRRQRRRPSHPRRRPDARRAASRRAPPSSRGTARRRLAPHRRMLHEPRPHIVPTWPARHAQRGRV